MKGAARGLAALALALQACAAPASAASPGPSLATWRRGLSRLAELRAGAASRRRTLEIGVAVREPITGKTMRGRGAVAVRPPSGLRMILVGPGGTTALDLWSDARSFRFAVPALDLVRRGDPASPEAGRGLPVAFLRWWLLEPLPGRLLHYEPEHREPGPRAAPAERFVLRDGNDVVDLRVSPAGLRAIRRTLALPKDAGEPAEVVDVERIDADRIGCGRARYAQASTGLVVSVTCSGEAPRPPDERAFVDPDAPEASP